ncbi:MAG: OadG family protein [Spirochaetaceae bacterium]|jgi:oxaloacetate decarboxylase gamma subunit|nr:OadG family protein [Spirochaetaceae bacterium]
MNIEEMFEQSAILTALGMGVVFVFLWFMIICMNVLTGIVRKIGLDKDTDALKKDVSKNTGAAPLTEITVAISAAVAKYREKNKDAI